MLKLALIPLFSDMGYKVDYYGGPSEGGKDLICWKNDDFGEKLLTVIQVKKTRFSAAASSPRVFSEIVTQLSQAIEKKVPDLDGTEKKPHNIFFITPYEINTRELESRSEGYSALRSQGVRVYDGNNIAKQLIDRKLAVVTELLGEWKMS